MDRSFNRILDVYVEKHHIIPKCMGGNNESNNIAILTAEEHYIAHQLLTKIYPTNIKLVYALNMMAGSNKTINRLNNKQYSWIRKKLYKIRKEFKHSDETRKHISESKIGIKLSKEHCKNIGLSKRGKLLTPKAKENVSLGIMKRTKRAWNYGTKGWRTGISHSDESKLKMRMASLGCDSRKKTVYQFSLTGELLNKFISIRQASSHTGIGRKSLKTIHERGIIEYKDFLWIFISKP